MREPGDTYEHTEKGVLNTVIYEFDDGSLLTIPSTRQQLTNNDLIRMVGTHGKVTVSLYHEGEIPDKPLWDWWIQRKS